MLSVFCATYFRLRRDVEARCVHICSQCAHDRVGPFMLVIKSWFCVKAEVTTCLLEKEEDTCTEKVLALFSSPFNPFLHSHFLPFSYAWRISIPKRGSCATLALSLGHWRKQTTGSFTFTFSVTCLPVFNLDPNSSQSFLQFPEDMVIDCCLLYRCESINQHVASHVFQLTPPTLAACCMRHLSW